MLSFTDLLIMNRFGRLLFLLYTISISSSLFADGDILTIWQGSEKAVEFSFSEKPKLVYESDKLVVSTNQITVEYPLKGISQITFNGNQNGINSVQLTNGNRAAIIYTINGQQVRTIDTGERISISTLPKGIYVIEKNGESYKVIVK